MTRLVHSYGKSYGNPIFLEMTKMTCSFKYRSRVSDSTQGVGRVRYYHMVRRVDI